MTAKELRAKLTSMEVELGSRVESLERDIQSGVPSDFEEQATARENDEVLDRLDEASRAELLAIRAAFVHLDQNGFNVCSKCGGAIGDERLALVPTAILCVICAG